jgi:hypothetical protein
MVNVPRSRSPSGGGAGGVPLSSLDPIQSPASYRVRPERNLLSTFPLSLPSQMWSSSDAPGKWQLFAGHGRRGEVTDPQQSGAA